ncbi:MAG: Glyoxalase family protein [uncultured Rubrobacteraceae bacterium]|uniref:Glyoxalase family protein n=1 Tax=uncultured Rubrobacteraceae bacterium TaxID=349277 RepID=A0A6J4RTG3_9ACTN|nr:MAG: Glyoxalase family protein [uncultured Rubrobacteraceae bacterium]
MTEQGNPSENGTDSQPRLPDTLRLGSVHLTVTDLDRSVGFYEKGIGLRLHRREDGVAAMGVGGEDLLVLYGEPGARRAGRHAGLYHYALLFPSREELARVAVRLAATRTPIQGASDHGTHEAIYLPDPDGNGIELAADRPRGLWPRPLDYAGGPHRLDVEGLMTAVGGEGPAARVGPSLVVGHVHLHVGDLQRGLGFYRDTLGFDLMTFMPGAAAFVSAGGYHHHLGFNVWRGEGVPPLPEGTVGLRHWTVVLERSVDVDAVGARAGAAGIATEDHGGGLLVRDPWGIAVLFVTPEALET